MARAICLDASVLIKLAVAEPGADVAARLVGNALRNEDEMVAPSFAMAEALSVLRGKVQRGKVVQATADAAIEDLLSLPIEEVSGAEMYRKAWGIASELGLPVVYDAVYLAVAEMRSATFWTADEALYRRVSDRGYARLLRDDSGE